MRLVALLLVCAVLTACSDESSPPEPEGGWTEAAQMPLSPRAFPQVGWTGSEVLVIGGDVGIPTNPSASGSTSTEEFVADGAAYDPAADTWRKIADAPEPLAYYFRTTMVGDVMVVQTSSDDGRTTGWLAYDAGDDAWLDVPDPPTPASDHGSISSNGGSVLALTERGIVLLLDVASMTWSQLPTTGAPVGKMRDACIAPGEGDNVYVSDGSTTYTWDGKNWFATGVDGCWRHWSGTRLTDGFTFFDPKVLESGDLPGAPDVENDRAPDYINANATDGPLVATYGYAYDDRDVTWTPFGRPDSPVDYQTGATWADGELVVVGGLDGDAGYEDTSGLSDETWIWTPPS